MCGREPNFELPDEDKQELKRQSWEEFLACTRQTITNKSKVLLTATKAMTNICLTLSENRRT